MIAKMGMLPFFSEFSLEKKDFQESQFRNFAQKNFTQKFLVSENFQSLYAKILTSLRRFFF